jgi:hypothetical protein
MNASEGPSASDRNFAQIRASKQRISTQMRRFKRHEAQIVTSGLNFTQNHRFEFAVAAAAGAVD